MEFEIAQQGDHVAVRGLSTEQVTEAVTLLATVRELTGARAQLAGLTMVELGEAVELVGVVRQLQSAQVDAIRANLVDVLMLHHRTLTPPAVLAQANRLAVARDGLLSTGVATYSQLRELRGDAKESSTRTWAARARTRGALFTVSHDGRTLVPTFQLTDAGDSRPELAPLLGPLLAAGVDGWELWTWLTSPASLLSGGVPEILARTDPQRAARAATRFAGRTAA